MVWWVWTSPWHPYPCIFKLTSKFNWRGVLHFRYGGNVTSLIFYTTVVYRIMYCEMKIGAFDNWCYTGYIGELQSQIFKLYSTVHLSMISNTIEAVENAPLQFLFLHGNFSIHESQGVKLLYCTDILWNCC